MSGDMSSRSERVGFTPHPQAQGDDRDGLIDADFDDTGTVSQGQSVTDTPVSRRRISGREFETWFTAQLEVGESDFIDPLEDTAKQVSKATVDQELADRGITNNRLNELERSIGELQTGLSRSDDRIEQVGSMAETHAERIDKLEEAVGNLQKHSQVIETQRQALSKTVSIASLLAGVIGVVVAAGIWFLPLTGIPLGLRAFSILIVLIVTAIIAVDGAVDIYTPADRESA